MPTLEKVRTLSVRLLRSEYAADEALKDEYVSGARRNRLTRSAWPGIEGAELLVGQIFTGRIGPTHCRNEREFIAHLEESRSDLQCLNQVKINPLAVRYVNIEPCDFLSNARHFIHLKGGHSSDPSAIHSLTLSIQRRAILKSRLTPWPPTPLSEQLGLS